MEIETVIVGELEENCYILKKNNQCLIIDPGDEFNKINEKINNYNLLGVLITHHHFDHVGALKELVDAYKVPVFDYLSLQEGIKEIGPFKFETIFNPGHTKDSISFYFKEDNIMFVGDFIFKNSIGRCDLEGGSYIEMKQSINRLKQYENDIILYPGHFNKTTLNEEKKNNSFF